MCGFIAVVTPPERPVPFTVLADMTDAIAHRGPDDAGFAWIAPDGQVTASRAAFDQALLPGVLFGHRRLSILDLSEASHQPFVSSSGSVVLAYNGEIYNYVELRDELSQCGVQFRSHGDTEVLLAAYERWGADAFGRLNGMWACALWDQRHRRLVVSRDRFGIKPLYVANVDGTWIFGSELKALIRFPGMNRGLDDDQVLEFLATGLTSHSDSTFFSAVRSVPAASVMELTDGRLTTRRYWTLAPDAGEMSEAEAVETYRVLLEDAVRIRMRSDVTVGTMLSGGLDSTSITAIITGQARRGGLSGSEAHGMESFHHTFTACWPEAPAVNEEREVDLMCSRFGLASHKVYPSATQVADLLRTITYHLDEPFENPVPAVQYLLMAEARSCGVKVVLNGHGSDEALGGYPDRFVSPFLAGLLLRGRFSEFQRERSSFGPWGSLTAALFECAWRVTPGPARPSLARLGTRPGTRERDIFGGVRSRRWSRVEIDDPVVRRMTPLNAALWRSYRATVLPRWLQMEDRMSMAHGVESRLPFTDYRLIELAFALPDTMKLRDGRTKFVLRQAMRNTLPDTIVQDQCKLRFAAPYTGWLRRSWRPIVEELLLGEHCAVGRFVDRAPFQGRVRAYLAGDDRAIDPWTLWRFLQTEMWMDVFGRGGARSVGV